MEKQTVINWGIIGCGDVTEVKSGPAYQKVDNFKLTAVMRRNADLAKDYAQRHNVEKHYADANALINDPYIDAIYIATPPDTHKSLGLLVAAAGKPCCIEKPLAPTLQESQTLLAAFDEAKVPLFVAYYRRSLPRFEKVKALLDNGDIGVIRHINWHLSAPASELDKSKQTNWRTDKAVAPGGYFDDLASHGLNLFAHLLGDFEQVKGISLNQQGLYSAIDAVSACWMHKNGITGAGSWNFGTGARPANVVIYGSEGEIEFSIFDDTVINIRSHSKQREIYIEHPENVQFYHVQNIRDQLIDGMPHPSNGASAVHTSWVMDQILSDVIV